MNATPWCAPIQGHGDPKVAKLVDFKVRKPICM